MHPGSDYLDKIAADAAAQAEKRAALRDTFAAAALTGLLAAAYTDNAEEVTQAAYDIADLMLAARLKQP